MTDPNILAWKGLSGPWQVTNNTICYEIRQQVTDEGVLPRLVAIGGLYHSEDRLRNEATAHMISAAPTAIELLSDMLEEIETEGYININEFISRAEEIIKKAYNF